MRREDVDKMLELVSDEHLTGALQPPRRRPAARKWGTLAACLALCEGLGALSLRLLPHMGGASSGTGGSEPESAADAVFLSYAGPVFPLTVEEGGGELEARRSLTYDFSAYAPRSESYTAADGTQKEHMVWSNELQVTDAYQFSNPTDQDQTLTLLYPFVASYISPSQALPELSAGGQVLESELLVGASSHSYTGAWGDEESGEKLNLQPATNWQDYKTLLEDGLYQADALSGAFPLSQETVTVYRFEDAASTSEENPSLCVELDIDPAKTRVLSYGFHFMDWDEETGHLGIGFSIPKESESRYDSPFLLILVGEDVKDYTLTGSRAGQEPDFPVTVTANVTRTTQPLDQVLREAFGDYLALYGAFGSDSDALSLVSEEQILSSACRLLYEGGMLSDEVYSRYETGWLEDIFSDTLSADRIFYLRGQAEIPAGGSLPVQLNFTKQPSFNYPGTGGSSYERYDMVTRLGSSLSFTSLSATLLGGEWIEIGAQNYGFDPENGVEEVNLDLGQEYYYLDVCRRAE